MGINGKTNTRMVSMLRMKLLVDNTTPKLKYCKRCGQLKTIYDFDKRNGKYITVCHSCKTPKPDVVKQKTPDCVIVDGMSYDTTIFKKCSCCGEVKNIGNDFRYTRPSIKDTFCRDCRNLCGREYIKNKKQKIKNFVTIHISSKKCSKCGETKLIEFFGNSNLTKDGKTTQCKDCINSINSLRSKNKTQDEKKISKQKSKHSRQKKKNERKLELELLDKTTDRLTKTFKVCKHCNINKPLKDFISDWTCVDGRKNVCRECTNKADRDRYANSEIKREKNSIKNKKYNKEKKTQRTEYNNKPDVKERNAKNRRKNVARRRKEDPQYYVIETLRTSVRSNFKRYSEKGKVHKSLKYGIDYLAIFQHIGPQPGEGFEMDHIIPCSVFPDLNIPGIIAMLYHPTNIQWLSKEKNLLKWDHIIPDLIREKKLEWICESIGISLEEHEENNYLLNIIKQED